MSATPIKSGCVEKHGRWMGTPRRHLELSPDELSFRKQQGGAVRRKLPLSEIRDVRAADEAEFEVVTPERCWTLRAESQSARDEWIAAINDARKPAAGAAGPAAAAAAEQAPSVVQVSAVASAGQPEVVVARDPALGAALQLGALTSGARVVLGLAGAGAGSISVPLSTITGSRGEPFWVAGGGCEAQLQVRVAPAPAAAQGQGHVEPDAPAQPSFVAGLLGSRIAIALAGAFLVACAVCVFYEPLAAEAQSAILGLGCLLAAQVIVAAVSAPRKAPAASKRVRADAPRATYSLAVLAVRASSGSTPEAGPQPEPEPEVNEAFERFVRGCFGDRDEAQRRWDITQAWRAEENVDAILDEPQPYYTIIKKYYPHYVHGFDKLGHPVYFERPGFVDLKALKRSGVGLQQLLRHYLFITENLWNNIAPSEEARTMTVLDVTGIGIRDLAGDVFEFIRGASHFVQEHYPERSFKIVIINVPGWFNMIWKMIKPLINEVTRQKISIMGSSGYQELLLDLIEPENLPREYGGTCNCGGPGGECRFGSKEERDQAELVARITPEPVMEG